VEMTCEDKPVFDDASFGGRVGLGCARGVFQHNSPLFQHSARVILGKLYGARTDTAFEPLVQAFYVAVWITGARQWTERQLLRRRHRHGYRGRSERSLVSRSGRPYREAGCGDP
jgi:hypothetical protein